MSRTVIAAALIAILSLVSWTRADAEEEAAVRRAVLDYVEAIYHAQPELIERSVHPALHKQGLYRPEGASDYGTPLLMGYEQLVDLAARWNPDGRRGDLTHEVEVLDMLDVTAAAKLTASWGVDYMQLMKSDGTWKIVQIVWQSHPAEG